MNKSCGNCKHKYENYLDYIGGPCEIFGIHFGNDGWKTHDPNEDKCKFWEQEANDKSFSEKNKMDTNR